MRVWHNPRVGRVNPVHVGIYFAKISVQTNGQRHTGSVRAAPPQGVNFPQRVNALKTGDNNHLARSQLPLQPHRINGEDFCPAINPVGSDTSLFPSERNRLVAHTLQGNGQQGHALLLPGRHQHIHLPF